MIVIRKIYKKLLTICLIVIVIVLGFVSFCLGKYTGYITLQVRTEIANPKFAVEFNEPIEITANENEKTYTFTVKNYEVDENQNRSISEVDFEYFIQILADTEESITYELYRGEESVNIDEKLATNYIKMNADNVSEHKYSLKVICEKTNVKEDIVNEAKVKVYCKQVNKV